MHMILFHIKYIFQYIKTYIQLWYVKILLREKNINIKMIFSVLKSFNSLNSYSKNNIKTFVILLMKNQMKKIFFYLENNEVIEMITESW